MMKKILGISGFVHVVVFAGIIYFCVTYDYTRPLVREDQQGNQAETLPVQAQLPQHESLPDSNLEANKLADSGDNTSSEIQLGASNEKPTKIIEEKVSTPIVTRAKAPKAKKSVAKIVPTRLPPAKFAPRKDHGSIDKEVDQVLRDQEAKVAEFESSLSKNQAGESIPAQANANQPAEIEKTQAATQANNEVVDDGAKKVAVDTPKAEDTAKEESQTVAANQTAAALESKDVKAENNEKKGDKSVKTENVQVAASSPLEEKSSAVTEIQPRPNGEEVRSVEQFRQANGNPVPKFDDDDRLKGRQGVAVFQAFVTREGGLKEFDLVNSTGHRSLDLKSLKALRDWKFEPGQEGWVEIPFQWSLTGNPVELPSKLRRKAGRK